MGALSDRIGDLEPKGKYENEDWATGFYAGTEEAANLAKEADELMARMEAVLESASVGAVVIDAAKDVLDELDKWKERTK